MENLHHIFSSYFIAQDAEEVRRVTVFCKVKKIGYNIIIYITFKSCHEQVKTVSLITKCKCSILKEENELKQKCKEAGFLPIDQQLLFSQEKSKDAKM